MPTNIPTNTKKVSNSAYITWDANDPKDFARASAAISKAYDSSVPLQRSSAAISNRFANIDHNVSVRDSFSRLDYSFFRPGEQIPQRFRDIIFACNGSYEKIAIVREVIDMMGDFGSTGIRIVHPNQSIERFYQAWFKEIGGEERSERLLNYLYRLGNVVIKRSTGKLKAATVQTWKRANAKSGAVVETDLKYTEKAMPGKMEIPLRYTFLNPMVLEVIGEEIAQFTGKVHFALKLPMNMYRSLNMPLTTFDPAILTEELPKDIQGAMHNNDRYLVLDPAKLITCYYKKDDWNVWAYPMIYSLLDDLILFQKMKLADLTALDGVISHIRIWKLGSLEHKIWPNDSAIQKLSSILLNHTAGGAIDLIWGPDITVEETSTDVYKFLDGGKYQGVMAHIHQGLGIPTSLSGNGGTFSESMISLRTLLERLKYGRGILKNFWEAELKLVQQAMGFRYPAQVTFDNMNLHDEVAEKALWIQLCDRDLVSIESVQEKFGQIPEIEEIRLKRQYKKVQDKDYPDRVSPYHDAQPDLSLEKIFAQRGVITPSQVGLDLPKPSRGEKNAVEMQGELQLKAIEAKPTPTGVSGQGRPKNKKDSKKRKTKTVNPRSTAETISELSLYANRLQKTISDVINPYFLEKFSQSEVRSGPGCLMVPIPTSISQKIKTWSKKFIPDDYLYLEKDESAAAYDNYGREDMSHVTVVYGFENSSEQEIRKFVRENYSDLDLTLGNVSKFSNEKYDVIKIDVESPQLKQLHDDLVKNFNVQETFDKYRPHVTIAYVKKGLGDELVGSEAFAGKKVNAGDFIYSEGEGLVQIKSRKNLRMLTKGQVNEMEDFKFNLLYNIDPYTVNGEEELTNALNNKIGVYDNVRALYEQMQVDFMEKNKEQPSYDDLKNIRSVIYAIFKGSFEEEANEEV